MKINNFFDCIKATSNANTKNNFERMKKQDKTPAQAFESLHVKPACGLHVLAYMLKYMFC